MGEHKQKEDGQEGGMASGALYAVIILVIIGVALVLLNREKAVAPTIDTSESELTATTSTATTTATTKAEEMTQTVSATLPSERAVKILASGVGAKAEDITVVATEDKVWPDSCLGLAKTDEVCAQVVTPGYLVKLKYDGVLYQYRTDEKVNQIRFQK